jgi:hypothetical protein
MPKTMKAYREALRAVNAEFRALKKKDGKAAARLADRKDALIDAMQATHRHRTAYETAGAPSNGPFGLGGGPERFCPGCGLAEGYAVPDGYKALGGAKTISLEHPDYVERRGRALRTLGINLVD